MADIISVEDYKLYLHRTYGNSRSDKDNEFDIYYSNILLPGLTKTLEYYFDNDFQSIERTQTHSVQEKTKKLFFDYKPVSSITSVVVSGTTLDADAYELLQDEDSIVLSSDINIGGQVFESYCWPKGYNHIVVTYTGGYALERGDKWSLCKLIAMVDNSDTRQYDNIDGAMDSFASVLTKDSVLYDMLNTQFKRYFV